MMTCFGHWTIIRPSLQNLEQRMSSANNVHVIWDPVRLTFVLKYIYHYKMNVFLACGVLKLTCIFHLKAFLLSWIMLCY